MRTHDHSMTNLLCKRLISGRHMPTVAFSTAAPASCLEVALIAGYRHLVTDSQQNDDVDVGQIIRQWQESRRADRQQLFLTVKVTSPPSTKTSVRSQCVQTLYNLRAEYIDLLLLQGPNDKNDTSSKHILVNSDPLLKSWKALESLVDEGRARSLGLCNLNVEQVEQLLQHNTIQPALLMYDWENLFRASKQFDQIRSYAKYRGMQCIVLVNTYEMKAHLGKRFSDFLEQTALKHKKVPEQVLVKGLQQLELSVILTTANAKEIRNAFKLFDWTLGEEDLENLRRLLFTTDSA